MFLYISLNLQSEKNEQYFVISVKFRTIRVQ